MGDTIVRSQPYCMSSIVQVLQLIVRNRNHNRSGIPESMDRERELVYALVSYIIMETIATTA